MLWNVVAWLQLFGGCASESYTACSCHLIPAKGFWCSCSMPITWPSSCSAVPRPYVVVRFQP